MAETEEVVEEAEVTEEEIIEETIVETVEEEETEEVTPGTSKKKTTKKTVKKTKKTSPKKKKGGGKSKKGGKGKRKGSIVWGRRPPPEVPSFSPCPHIYFKRKEADRSKLKKSEYIDMLATPRREPWKDFMKTDDDLIPYRRRKLTARTNCLAIPKKMYVKAILEEFVDVLNDNQKDNLKEILQTECDFTKENPQESQNQSGTSKTTKSGGQDTGTKKKDQRAKSAAGGKRPASSGGTSKSAGSKPNKAENLEQKENEEPAVSEEVTESKVEETEAQENPTTDEPVEEPQNEDENFVDAT